MSSYFSERARSQPTVDAGAMKNEKAERNELKEKWKKVRLLGDEKLKD